jgi:hypothetical protein
MKFESILLNYTLYDGLNYKNGLLVKYYTNNNFLGKPLYVTRIPSSYIDSNDIHSNWYMFHKEFKDFSVKMTTMLYLPEGVGNRLTFTTTFDSRFQLFVNDQLVINFDMPYGMIDLPGNGMWIKVKMLYRFSGNKENLAVPSFTVKF